MGLMETVIDIPAEHEANVFGQFDVYAKKIERALHVTLIARGAVSYTHLTLPTTSRV